MSKQYNQLFALQESFTLIHQEHLILGAELEFYLVGNLDLIVLEQLIGYEIKQEKGVGQYEINFAPCDDLTAICQEIEQARNAIMKYSKELGGSAIFDPKPFPDDYGSSMHIHINGSKNRHEIESYAQILCNDLSSYIYHCLPRQQDWARLDERFMAPTHICWGGNNRTTMIRIPDSYPKRLEHRLPGANVDSTNLIIALMSSLIRGLGNIQQEQINKNFPKIHGNAYHEQYNLPLIRDLKW